MIRNDFTEAGGQQKKSERSIRLGILIGKTVFPLLSKVQLTLTHDPHQKSASNYLLCFHVIKGILNHSYLNLSSQVFQILPRYSVNKHSLNANSGSALSND